MATTEDFLKALNASPRRVLHGLARFSRHLTQGERNRLEKFGIHVLEPYQRTTYWVSVTYPARILDVQTLKLDMSLIRLHDEDRVHPKIWQGNLDEFSAILPGNQPANFVVNSDKTLNLTVRFHADVSEIQAMEVLGKHAQTLTKKTVVTWVVVTERKAEEALMAVKALAKEDFVQWIDAGPLPFIPENDHTREAIKVDAVQTSNPTNNGSGVAIGIFDAGVDETHPDISPRIIVSSAGFDHHATRVAGTVAGDGSRSPDSLYRGMASGAQLFDEPSSVGDDAYVHASLIRDPGMHLSNHSYAVSTTDGQYGLSDRNRDGIINGIGPDISFPPRLHVYSAGNRGCIDAPNCTPESYQTGYFSLTKQLKNGLVVGNWNHWGTDEYEAGRNQIFPESSLGPTHDGRIKPDVVAPGTDVMSTACLRLEDPCYAPSTPWYYGGASGTSMAAAAVTGSLALLFQQYARTYLVEDLNLKAPLPSTLRAIMIHTAADIKVDNALPPWFSNADGPVKPTLGPDFVTGWGLVNVKKATQAIKNKFLYEDTVENECETKIYAFNVKTDHPIRVTLAWDDPPYAGSHAPPFTDPTLVNDLDLILFDPTGRPYYSWKLDQKIVNSATDVEIPDGQQSCTTPIRIQRQFEPQAPPSDTIPPGGVPSAVRGRDHLNNVEVVDVDAPTVAGVWQVKVIGFSIPMESQPFSLVGYRFHDATIPPIICNLHPHLCGHQMSDVKLYPTTNKIIGEFRSSRVIRLKTLCELGFTCPPCAAEKRCRRYILLLDMISPLEIEVYTFGGRLVQRSSSATLSRRIDFEGAIDEEYLLVLYPAAGTVGERYKFILNIFGT